MLRNYLTTAFRTLRRNRVYAVINVAGLALGMAACLLIGLYISDELSFDRFHRDADRLLLLAEDGGMSTAYPLATVAAELPDVAQAVRLGWGSETPVEQPDSERKAARRVVLADASFFEVFTFPLESGDPAQVLAAPDAAVISASTARQFFGEADPVGEVLAFEAYGEMHRVVVAGVAADAPVNSTIRFDIVARLDLAAEQWRRPDGWGGRMYRTYVRLEAHGTAASFEPRLQAAVAPHLRPGADAASFTAVPLPDVYLSPLYRTSGFNGQARYLYIFGAVALFILLIAAINYVNLVTALAGTRAREVGVRKTMGAGHGQLARQFLGESVLLSLAALVAAAALASVALPGFNALFDKSLAVDFARDGAALAGLAAFVVVVGVVSGAYPALVLARFEPAEVLRGGRVRTGGGGLRRGLVVVQFAVTAVLLVSTLAVFGQLDYMQGRALGFAGEQVVVVDLPRSVGAGLSDDLRAATVTDASVTDASVADAVPGRFYIRLGAGAEELSPRARTEADVTFAAAHVDPAYVSTLGLELLAGRTFDPDRAGDLRGAYVINRTAAETLGWTPEEAIGMPFAMNTDVTGVVIGVVEDFHLRSLRDPIEPVLLLQEHDGFTAGGELLAARLRPGAYREGLAHLEAVVARFAPGEAFSYRFLDDEFDAMYRSEERLGRIFTTFAFVAILIACLGLFGLASFVVARRTKEIGIRKVLGANAGDIVVLVTREFAVLVAVALAVGAPVGYLLMDRWLDDFAYRIELGAGLFLAAAAIALVVAGLAVAGQSLRAAFTDPVDALRYE